MLKKVKHRLVENMSSGTADALGLSRAILCNGRFDCDAALTHTLKVLTVFGCADGLVKRLEELEKTAELYKGTEAQGPRSCLESSACSFQTTEQIYSVLHR